MGGKHEGRPSESKPVEVPKKPNGDTVRPDPGGGKHEKKDGK
ncbi:hypothetical protein [Microbispora sp. NPDC049125]